MSVKLKGSSSGSVSIDAPANTAGGADRTLTLPDDSSNGVIKTSTYPSSIQVLEQFFSPCDGSVIATSAGNVTLPTVTAKQDLTTSYADVTGSSITYTPPTGTTQVIYEFYVYKASADDHSLHHQKLFIDSDEVTKSRFTHRGTANFDGTRIVFKWGINIGGSADTTVGRLASWTSGKTIKCQAREYDSNHETSFHETGAWDGGSGAHLSLPCLGITAIGAA